MSDSGIPASDYDKKKITPRESVALAIEAAKAAQVLGAPQVIENLKKHFGDLVPDSALLQPLIPPDAIPFRLNYADGMEGAGLPIPSGLEIDAPDDIVLENYETLRQWGEEWILNMGLCAPLIHADHERLGEKLQAHFLDLEVEDPTQAVVCASGSSLDALTELLPSFPGLIICGASNASAVVAAGAKPHAILAVDAGIGTVAHLQGVPFDSFGIPLVCATSIHPDVPRLFPSHRKWFTSIIQMAQGAQHPFNVFSHMLFPFIKSMMFQAGCTANAEVLLLNLLEEMGRAKFSAIYLLGADLCYKEEAARCKAYKYEGGAFKERAVGTGRSSIQTRSRIMRSFNGLVTDESMLGYKKSLLTLWVITKLPLYDCSEGIVTEVPRADFRLLARGKFRGRPPSYSYDEVIASYNRYLAAIGYVQGKTAGHEGTEVEGELWKRP